jgi:hypothetical protein
MGTMGIFSTRMSFYQQKALSLEEVEDMLVTQIRHSLCERWWRSLRYKNDGSQTDQEFQAYVEQQKRRWWRWNFGEEMP